MNEKITAHPQKEEREKVLKEIRQLENRKKILENKQRNEGRRVRTRRLIERGAILEGIFPMAPNPVSYTHLNTDSFRTGYRITQENTICIFRFLSLQAS